MTPWGSLVRQYRAAKNISLKQMADGVGLSPSYLSAIELGSKGHPKTALVEKTIKFLRLTQPQQAKLRLAAERSNQIVKIPNDSSPETYHLVHLMAERVSNLSAREVQVIAFLLDEDKYNNGGCYEY